MSWIVLVRPEAERDLAAAHGWYEARSSALGDEFLTSIAAALRSLEQDPMRERLYFRHFRRVMPPRFPYKIFYQVIDRRVIVFRVLHAKQDHGQRIRQA